MASKIIRTVREKAPKRLLNRKVFGPFLFICDRIQGKTTKIFFERKTTKILSCLFFYNRHKIAEL